MLFSVIQCYSVYLVYLALFRDGSCYLALLFSVIQCYLVYLVLFSVLSVIQCIQCYSVYLVLFSVFNANSAQAIYL